MIEDKKIGENDKAVFYTNLMCHKYSDGYYTIVAKKKDTGYTTYLLCNADNQPVYESQSIEAIYYHHLAIEINKSDRLM